MSGGSLLTPDIAILEKMHTMATRDITGEGKAAIKIR